MRTAIGQALESIVGCGCVKIIYVSSIPRIDTRRGGKGALPLGEYLKKRSVHSCCHVALAYNDHRNTVPIKETGVAASGMGVGR